MPRESLVVVLLVLMGCAHTIDDPNYDPDACSHNGGYGRGYNDGRAGKPMNLKFSRYCHSEKDQAEDGYREGYARARQESTGVYPAVVDGGDTDPRESGGPGININIGGVQAVDAARDDRPRGVNERAYYCSIEMFSNTFDSFGPTKLEARKITVEKCIDKHRFRSSCERRLKCRENR